MPDLQFVEAFARYKAKLRNPQWSVCAFAPDGSLVVSLWEHHFGKPVNGMIKCSGSFDRWKGPGNTEFREAVAKAFKEDLAVRVVISHTDQPAKVDAGADGSTLNNTFSVREDWIGRVSRADANEYEFEFRRQ